MVPGEGCVWEADPPALFCDGAEILFLLLFRESLSKKELTLKGENSLHLHVKQKYQYLCFQLGYHFLLETW